MQDHAAPNHGFVSPWFRNEEKRLNEEDYFPDDYPVDEKLVMPAVQTRTQQRDD